MTKEAGVIKFGKIYNKKTRVSPWNDAKIDAQRELRTYYFTSSLTWKQSVYDIAVMSQERHDVSNHRQQDFVQHDMFILTANK